MRISYWSSDVCSSDLLPAGHHGDRRDRTLLRIVDDDALGRRAAGAAGGVAVPARLARDLGLGDRAAAVDHPDVDRKSVVQGTSGSVRVVVVGRRILKKKNFVAQDNDTSKI